MHHLSTTSCAPVVQTSSSQRVPALTLWCQLPNIWRQTKHHLSTSCAPMPLLSIKTWDSKDTKSSLDQLFSIPSCESGSWLPWEEMGEDIPCKRELDIQVGRRRVTILGRRVTTRWDMMSHNPTINSMLNPGSPRQGSTWRRPYQAKVGNPLQKDRNPNTNNRDQLACPLSNLICFCSVLHKRARSHGLQRKMMWETYWEVGESTQARWNFKG